MINTSAHIDSLVFELTGHYPIEFDDFAAISKDIHVPVKVLHEWASGKAPDWLLPVILRAKCKGVSDSVDVLLDNNVLTSASHSFLDDYISDLNNAIDSYLEED